MMHLSLLHWAKKNTRHLSKRRPQPILSGMKNVNCEYPHHLLHLQSSQCPSYPKDSKNFILSSFIIYLYFNFNLLWVDVEALVCGEVSGESCVGVTMAD